MSVVEEIAAERERQIKEEGFDREHDAHHFEWELSLASICYAAPENIYIHRKTPATHGFHDPWPWHRKDDKRHKHGKRRRLIIAAALLVAEIERLDKLQEGTLNDVGGGNGK